MTEKININQLKPVSTDTNLGNSDALLPTQNAVKTYVDNKVATYTFEQAVAASTWNIVHNLDKHPSVTVVDSAGTIIDCSVTYINSNECELNFNAAFKGTAYLN